MNDLNDVTTFIEKSSRVTHYRELESLMVDVTKELGFNYYALIHHVDLSRYSMDLQHMADGGLLALSNYPESWIETYVERNIVANDPVLLASQRTSVGFVWEDMGQLIKVTPVHHAIMEDSRRAGVAQGFTIPVNIPGEANGSCAFAVRTGRALPVRNLPLAQLVGSFAFQAARKLVLSAQSSSLGQQRPLSERQLQCVTLVARGKSDWEIGRILGISEETVKRHLALARAHYDVPKRIQLVTRAIFEGQIALADVLK
ncbi:LuxR family transcriptional regulator [Rhizorhapis sp.]|uniref:helix-turn-helix transcriptional regulator n=1 Tax=Rhizorhapis sp. TaxID=1968842 RepID=UPI002B4A2100|nr:LuxR family transcriptional regulator [Rhizorhapis sp.]HKR16472.1 LuxR family transcriptional regulator [Rhizorhapis sp.]